MNVPLLFQIAAAHWQARHGVPIQVARLCISVRWTCSARVRSVESLLPVGASSPGAFCPNCAHLNSGPDLGTERQNERRAAFIEAAGLRLHARRLGA